MTELFSPFGLTFKNVVFMDLRFMELDRTSKSFELVMGNVVFIQVRSWRSSHWKWDFQMPDITRLVEDSWET